MRILTAMSVFLIGSLAMACPNLAGTYQCQGSDGSIETTTIMQNNKGGVTVYVVDGEEYHANGQAYNYTREEDGLTIMGAMMTMCQNGNVQISDQGTLFYGQQQVGVFDVLIEVMPDDSGFTVATTGYAQAGGENEVIEDLSTCTPM